MDNEFKRIIEKLEQFRSTHIKLQLPNRKMLIKQNCERFMLEYDGEANLAIIENKSEINITITADTLTSCDEGGYSFNCLVGLANVTNIDIVNGMLVIKLWYRLWDWIDK